MLSDNKTVQVVQAESTQVTQIALGVGLHEVKGNTFLKLSWFNLS